VTYDQIEINDRRACRELLVFQVLGGIQTGRWVLGLDADESSVRVPFDL
jgi:hypothetical protein